MKGIKDLDGEIDGLYSQLENIDALLNDFNVELNDYMQSMDFDDSEFRSVESRLDVINDIKGNMEAPWKRCSNIWRTAGRNMKGCLNMTNIYQDFQTK